MDASNRMFEQKVFSLKFFFEALRHFKDPNAAMLLIGPSWGLSAIDEAENNLGQLKQELLALAHHEFGAEYKGDRTFEKDVDEIIRQLRESIGTVKVRRFMEQHIIKSA